MDVNKPYNELPMISTLDLEISEPVRKLAEDTRVAVEILNYAVNTLPSPDILLDTLALQEARASSNIENIVTTNDDLYRGVIFEDYTAEAKEVDNYKAALFAGYEEMQQRDGVFGIGTIEAINANVNVKQPGIRRNLLGFGDLTQIARIQNGVKTVLYTPPDNFETINQLLLDMLNYVFDDESYDLHPLIRIALAHYQFECIHPFRDGNGRTGRILNILFLCSKGYLKHPVLYASSYIIQNKSEYYRLLQATREKNDYEPFIAYMLNSFKATAERTLDIVESIKNMIAEYTSDSFLESVKGQKETMREAVDLIFRKVYVRIKDLTDKGIHRQTASVYLDRFVDAGLLEKEKVGRDNIYKNVKLLALFETNGEETNE